MPYIFASMKIWKKSVLLSLLTLFTLTIILDSTKCFFKSNVSDFLCDTTDFDAEEKEKETEKSNEKNEKEIYFASHFSTTQLLYFLQHTINLELHSRLNFSSSDYSQVVYSPPEIA